jgi:hypothetical protein
MDFYKKRMRCLIKIMASEIVNLNNLNAKKRTTNNTVSQDCLNAYISQQMRDIHSLHIEINKLRIYCNYSKAYVDLIFEIEYNELLHRIKILCEQEDLAMTAEVMSIIADVHDCIADDHDRSINEKYKAALKTWRNIHTPVA